MILCGDAPTISLVKVHLFGSARVFRTYTTSRLRGHFPSRPTRRPQLKPDNFPVDNFAFSNTSVFLVNSRWYSERFFG